MTANKLFVIDFFLLGSLYKDLNINEQPSDSELKIQKKGNNSIFFITYNTASQQYKIHHLIQSSTENMNRARMRLKAQTNNLNIK